MEIEFSDYLPHNLNQAVCISGRQSFYFGNKKFLILKDQGENEKAFEIIYEYHCSPFQQAQLYNNLLIAGHENYFYLFDLKKNTNLAAIKLEGYFGNFQIHNEDIYICDAGSLTRVSLQGSIIWRNNHLGIDGVIIERFQDEKIFGSGEWDPPGGWRDFILSESNGTLLI